MKKSVLVLLLSIALCSAFGQTGRDEYRLDATLLKIKNILEKHFAGSHIYGLQEGFTIKIDSASNRYVFKSNVIKMRSKSQSEKLNSELNSRLRKQKNIKIGGQLYFDVHLDSILVYIKYSQPDTVYNFRALPSIPFPRKGYQAFAKGLHDEIKIKIKQGQISRDSVRSLRYFEMTVGRGQMIITDSQKFLVKPLDSFLSANRWTYGISSGIPYLSKAEIVVQKDYLLDKLPWFGEPVNKLYEGSRDSWGELKLITPNKVGTQTTFFSRTLPVENHGLSTIVSVTYDELLRKYCMPVIHFGSIKETRQLIDDIIASRELLGIYYDRIYFYRMK